MSFVCPQCKKESHHPKDEEYGYCGNCHDFTGRAKPQDKPTGINFWVQGIVAARNGIPYVQVATAQRMIAQFTIAEARNVALDLMRSASYAETDAMLLKYFQDRDLPREALGALLIDFREFRHQLDTERVNTAHTDSDSGEQK